MISLIIKLKIDWFNITEIIDESCTRVCVYVCVNYPNPLFDKD